jgi:hypothetical protein
MTTPTDKDTLARLSEAAQIELWFFRDIGDEARRKLIALCLGQEVADEAKFHDWQRKCLRRILTPRTGQLVERAGVVEILANLSSYLGAGIGDDTTTPEEYDRRIRWGIDHIGRVYRDRAAQVVEECSKRPSTTWGQVKRAILDDTCLPTASMEPTALAALNGGDDAGSAQA